MNWKHWFFATRQELSQEAAGAQMGVSRGTVQRLLTSGRKKVVGALAACGNALAITPVRHAVPAGEAENTCSSSSLLRQRALAEG